MRTIIIFCILLIPVLCFAQQGYVEFDTISYSGVKITDQGKRLNALSCQWQKSKNESVHLTPYEASSYATGGVVYVAKDVVISGKESRFFLEKLASGNLTLFFIKNEGKHFFVEKDSSFLIEIPKNKDNEKSTYKTLLKEITADCPKVADATNFVAYNQKSMTRFFKWYDKCVQRPFPHFRYGIKAGYEWTKINVSEERLEQFNFKYGGSFTAGLFMDVPIFVSDFSLNMGINYSRHGYSYNQLTFDKDNDFVVNLSSIKMPVLLRYSLPSNKYRFFMQSGGIIEYNFSNAHLYESTIYGNVITIERTQIHEIDDIRFGFSLGVGYEHRITTRNSLFLELSFNQLYGNMRTRDILLTIGINL